MNTSTRFFNEAFILLLTYYQTENTQQRCKFSADGKPTRRTNNFGLCFDKDLAKNIDCRTLASIANFFFLPFQEADV